MKLHVLLITFILSSSGFAQGEDLASLKQDDSSDTRHDRFEVDFASFWAKIHRSTQISSMSQPVLKPSPTSIPSGFPSVSPTVKPTTMPTRRPTQQPSTVPTSRPTEVPSYIPTQKPTDEPSFFPANKPSTTPSSLPTQQPSNVPTKVPSFIPTQKPTEEPSFLPTDKPTTIPTSLPTRQPSIVPTNPPSDLPTKKPTEPPSFLPTSTPTAIPTGAPTNPPTSMPTPKPTQQPSNLPSSKPTKQPSLLPTNKPTAISTSLPTQQPSEVPTCRPTEDPSSIPTEEPSFLPTDKPTTIPTSLPTQQPSQVPTSIPTEGPSDLPTQTPTDEPSFLPSDKPTTTPTSLPTQQPSKIPTSRPTEGPSAVPISLPTDSPSAEDLPSTGLDGQSIPNTQTPSSTPSFLSTNAQCILDVNMSCTLVSGETCDKVKPKEGLCAFDSPIEVMELRYIPNPCGTFRNSQTKYTCFDVEEVPMKGEAVSIACRSDMQTLQISPSEKLRDGDRVTLEGKERGALGKVSCEVSNILGNRLQVISFDTSEEINFKDVFGSLQVEGCNSETCLVTSVVEYKLSNSGLSELTISRADRLLNGEVEDLRVRFGKHSLTVGETMQVQETLAFDSCGILSSTLLFEAESSPPNGASCEGGSEINIESTPSCVGETTLGCALEGQSASCKELTGESQPQCICSECSSQLLFTYTGEDCRSSNTDASVLCRDLGTGHLPAGRVTVASTNGTLFDDVVFQGSSVSIRDSNHGCIGDFVAISIRNPLTNSTFQEIIIPSSCHTGQHLELSDSIGAISFHGYACIEEDHMHFCHVAVTHYVDIANSGQVNFTFADVSLDVNENELQLSYSDDQDLAPGETLRLSRKTTIDLCQTKTYDISASMEGVTRQNKTCVDGDNMEFTITRGTSFPTLYPSVYPSAEPTPQPTRQVTDFPSELPTQIPTSQPVQLIAQQTPAPTKSCDLEVEVNCTLPDGTPCDVDVPAVVPCTGRPTQIGLLLRGGHCNQSDNIQPDKFTCIEYNKGPPQPRSEDSVFIVAKDGKGEGRTYFTGTVKEGEVFMLEDGGLDLEADSIVSIFTDDSSRILLQNITFHSSCSQNLRLKDTFGAIQLVQWYNLEQGNVTCFADIQIDLTLSIPLLITGESLSIEQFFVIADFSTPQTLDLTSKILGSGSAYNATFNSTFDLTQKREYSITSAIKGRSQNGAICVDFKRHSFFAGSPVPPYLSTLAPTSAPSMTFQPSPDPQQTACALEATISCERPAKNRREAALSCQDLASNKDLKCVGSRAYKLHFLYTGKSCRESTPSTGEFKCTDMGKGIQRNKPVTLSVTDDKEETEFFREVVNRGQAFSITPSSKKIKIEVIDQEGKSVQRMELRIDCKSDKTDLRISYFYGSLQLDGFANGIQGEEKAIQDLQYTFLISNQGRLPATILWANRTSLVLGNQRQITPPGRQLDQGGILEFKYPFKMNLIAGRGTPFWANFSVFGEGTRSGMPCSSRDRYEFRIL